MPKLIPNNYYVNTAQNLNNDVVNSDFFVFFGDHIINNVTPTDTIDNLDIQTYANMIYGKKVGPTDVSMLIHKNMYTSNTVYDMYDSSRDLSNNNFYVVTNEATSYHVYKCLYNAGNTASLFQPSIVDVDVGDDAHTTGEGYIWKYMFSVTNAAYTKFSTVDYLPVVANTSVTANAKDKRIDVITVDFAGRGYNNHCNGTFRIVDLKVNGNPLVYAISASPSLVTVNNFYNDCYMSILSGAGVGQFAKITNYVTNSTSAVVYIDRQFNTNLAADSVFEISPGVVITSDGQQTSNAEARAVINASGNTVSSILVLSSGQGYNFANTYIKSNPVVGVTSNALIRAINSPPGGHGSNVLAELNARSVCISTQFSNTDIDIPQTNQYTKLGLIKNPVFSKATISMSGTTGSFLPGEPVYEINKVQFTITGAVTISQNGVSASDGDFLNQVLSGEIILIGDGANNQLATVTSIQNSNHLTISSNALFSSTIAHLYKTNARLTATAESYTVGTLNLKDIIYPDIVQNQVLIGFNSGAIGQINNITRSNVLKPMNTFIQMYKYVGTKISGSFVQNEQVYQSADGTLAGAFAFGNLQSSLLNTSIYTLYVTGQMGTFTPNLTVYGATSGATMTLSTKYIPELDPLSGEIVYLEKIDPITRTNVEKETIKFIFEF
jgi:hypothetical protein